MRFYLNAIPGPDGTFGSEILDKILGLGFNGLRTSSGDLTLEELAKYGLSNHVFLLLGDPLAPAGLRWKDKWDFHHAIDYAYSRAEEIINLGLDKEGSAIEIANEPDLSSQYWRTHPKELGELVIAAYGQIRQAGIQYAKILCPSISSPGMDRGIPYLEKMIEGMGGNLLAEIGIALHRYPNGRYIHSPQPGFKSRAAEVEKVREITSGREIWITEAGRSEGPVVERVEVMGIRTCLKRDPWYFTEKQVFDQVLADVAFWHSQGAKCYTLYQLNDGPDRNNVEDNFGIRRLDQAPSRKWKIIAERFHEIAEAFAG